MGKGRKPLPQEVLNLRGTARKDRQRPAAAITGKTITSYDIQCVSTPGYSTLTPRGRKIFAKACRTCIALKMLEPIYLSQLVAYARTSVDVVLLKGVNDVKGIGITTAVRQEH